MVGFGLQSLITALHIAAWSQLGVLVRIYLGLFLSNRCSGRWGVCVLSKDLGSNILGSFIMGLVVADSSKAVMFLPHNSTLQRLTDLQVGVRTGFCGSLTTFASWQLSVIQLLIGGKDYRGGQWDQYIVGQLGTGLFCSLGSYVVGLIVARASNEFFGKKDESNTNKESRQPRPSKTTRVVNVSTIILLHLLTALWIVLAIVDNKSSHSARRQQWFAILFAPFGACLRWQLSFFNGKISAADWLPIGTLAANMMACCIDFGLQGAINRLDHPSYWLTLLFGAVRVGFSGALSTVSTFVQEIHKLGNSVPIPIKSSIYGFGSIALASILGIIIYGWSVWA